MKQVTFIRHAKLEKEFSDYSKLPYNIFCDLAKGSIQPSIDSVEAKRNLEKINQKIDFQKFDKIFSANSKRAQQTAVLIANTYHISIVEYLNELSELHFDPAQLITESEFKDTGLKTVREKFQRLILGQDSKTNVKMINAKLKMINEILLKEKSQNILCITHGFFMHFIKLYFDKTTDLNQKEILNIDISNPFKNLEGFTISLLEK